MTFQVSSWLSLSKILFILLTLACSHSIKASDLLSDDFNPATQEQNPTWRFYDPYNLDNDTDNANSNEANEATLTLDGTNALISIPNGVTHDLWTPDNKAPRVLQPASDTDFQVEVKFETEPKIKHQLQGIIVQQTDEIFLRFDIFYNISEVAVFVAYIDNTTGNTTPYTLHHGPIGLGLAAFPNYQRVERSGDDWIFSYSSDGVNWTSLASFTQPITVTEVGFFAGTASSNPKFLSSVDYFIDLEDESPSIDVDTWIPPSTPLPVINTWYDHPETADSTIDFGLAGIPQPWANILGNVSSDINILTLSYTLNGGSGQALPMGANGNRLEREGDFNIEIDQANLLVGPNTIVIRAEDDNNQVVTKTVIINYAPANIGMPPYAVDWSSLSNNIQDVESIAHVVDGLWNLPTGGGIRTTETGYDRAIAIGDYETWLSDNYEITVPFTPHSNFAGIGFAVGWQGHIGSQSPRIEWPAQALAWVRGPVTSPRLEVLTYGGLPTSTWEVPVGTHEDLAPLTFNQKYILKSYSEPLSNGTSRFHVKFWQDGNVEPSDWNIQADVPTRDGSVLLVAYDGDITFGNVNITPVTITPPDTTPPVISNIQTTVTDSTATLSWTTDEPSNSVVDYGLNNNYGINVNDSIQTTTHSLILTGLNSNTLYHYQIKSSDSNGNVANSTDLELTTSTITTPSDSWWNNNWNYRASLTVHSGNHVRFEKPVETSINFTDYLTTADQATPFDVNSMRVHEVNASGAVITENIPFQFDPAIDFNATTKAEGNLIFLLSGNTASQANRYFQVYFDVEGGGYTASVFTDQVNVTDNIIDEGQSSFKIETDNASYFYQKEAGGFSSIVDNNGNDWISYHPAASGVSGAAGVYRGLPNLVFPEGYFHPGSTDASSTLLHEGPLKATIESVTNDNLWKVKWEFFPTFSRMTVTQADKNFWFLYEGTPGGTLDISDFVMRSNGVQNSVTESWTSDISNPEWVYFADPNVGNGRSLFVAHHNDDSAIDSYFPLDSATDLQMTVFGFGREGTNSSIDKNQTHQFTLGLTDSTDFSNTAGTIESAYNAITSTITANAQNPGNTGSDTTPPVVSNIQTVVTDTTATITWTTDEASSGKVNYGLDNTYGSNAVDSNTVLGTAHSVTLNGLTAGTEYHFEVVSTDESGNNSLPVDQVLTTDGASNNTPPIAADDSYTTSVEIALAVNIANGVLANDSDSDLDSITALLVDNVSNGTLTLNDDGSFNYIPNTGYSGTDSFTYQANDSLINSNLATVTITVTNSTGFCGKALQFDGANDWVNIPNLSFSGDFSIEAWVYLEPGIDSKDGLVGQEGTGQDINFYQGKVHLWAPNDVLVANTAMSASTWNHIAITRSSGNLTAYLNGVEDGTGVWTGVFAPKAIGRTNKGFLNGRLDEVRIWDIARNSTEIAANYNKSVATNSVGLVGYWTFNDDSNAQQVLDSSSSANSAFKGLDADASTDDPVQTNGSTLLNEDCAIGNTNVAPLINAGTDQTIILPSNATLSGIVSDDGLPTPPGAVTTLWTVISGPGTVTFTDATQLDTTASFSLDGTYVLDLTADDGELTSNDQLTIIVNAEGAANTAPTIHAGADQTLLLPSNATLSGIVSDDGLPTPPGAVTTLWTVISGPGTVTFTDATQLDTTASFSLDGTYVLDLTANDSELTSNAQVTITVNTAPTGSSDLLAHWPLNEGTGTSAGDITGNGYNGTLTNGPVWNGTELIFDGVNDYVNLGTLDVSGSALTLAGWVQTDDLGNCGFYMDCRILSKATGTSEQDHYWMISTIKVGSATRLRFRLKAGGTTSTLIASSGNLTNNELFHVAASYDGNTMRLYKDGVEVGSLAKTGAIDTNNTVEAWAGASPTIATARPWKGLIADIHVYQKALTVGELNTVKDSYNGGGGSTNVAPLINAGTDQTIILPSNATLNGIVSDDSLPTPPGTVTTLWTVISGPGTVTFTDATQLDTTASFSLDGTYVLDLTANDGELTSNAQVTIIVNAEGAANTAPTIHAGADQTLLLPSNATLSGIVSDDGLPTPPGAVTTLWTVISGPGTVTFTDATQLDTTASFSLDGTYVLDLTANDSELTSNAQVTITVNTAPTGSSDLLAHWPLNEGTGTSAGDITGNGYNGTLTNGPVWNGTELIFDGVNDYVNLGTLDVSGSALTLAGWVQTDDLGNCGFYMDCRILSKATGTSEQDHYWMISTIKVGSATRLRFRLKAGGTTSTLIASSGNLTNNELFHVAASYDGNTMRLYKDGVEVGSLAKTGAIDTNNTVEAWAGASPTIATARPWKGLIADIHVYQKALTVGELNTVKDSYNGGGGSTNVAPLINAGTDQTIILPSNATLNGIVSDDSLPTPPGTVTTLWTVISGPGTVTFTDATQLDTTASFSLDGTYVLDLTANDGELTSNAQVTIIVNAEGAANTAPTIHAGADQTLLLPSNATLSGIVSDDGLPTPPGAVTTLWTVISGPGTVTFTDATQLDTTASFSLDGTYVLDLTANDSELTSNAQVTITVNTAPTGSSDLLAHWPLNEGTGTSAGDITGNGYNGTLTNGPVWNGTELIFDGVNDYVNLGTLDVSGSALTLAGWVQTDDLGNCGFYMDCRILSKATGTSEQDHYWMISTIKVGSATRLRFRLKAGGTTSTLIASSGNLTNNELFHVAASYDGNTMRLYKDGVEVGSLAKTGAIDTNNTVEAWAGASPTIATARPWKGLIADIHVYQKALTVGELNTVKDSYNGGGGSTNVAPLINAGTDQTIILPSNATLNGIVSDDSLPTPPGTVTTLWTVISGPGTVTFTDATQLDTTASFSLDGTYVLDLTANDGELTSNAQVTIIVNAEGAANTAPTIHAGADQTLLLPSNATLSGIVSDDGLPTPPGAVTTLWTVISGPGTVTFTDATQLDTTASFSLDGTYVLDLTANDSELTSNAQVTITVNAAPTGSSDLLAHWPLNEGTGTSAGDITGNGYNGTLTNGPVWNGTELIFDGVNDYVNLGSLDISGSALTLTGWVQATDLANCTYYDCRILSKATGTSEQDHYWMISTTKVGSATRLRFRLKAGGVTSTLIATSGDISNGDSFHVVATYDGATMRLYKDGAEVGSRTKTGALDTNSTVEAWIGGNPGSSRPWDGSLTNVRIYQKSLTPTEVITIMNTDEVADVIAPIISNEQVTTTSSSATISWNTNEAADSNVSYGTSNAYENGTISDGSSVVSHSVTLSGLAEATTYHYQLESTDSSGNTATSIDLTFVTGAVGDEPELIMFDWNTLVTKSYRGFPRDKNIDSSINGDWTETGPINYANGTLYLRAKIKSGGQPVPQTMRLNFCAWQRDIVNDHNFGLEECAPLSQPLVGIAGNELTWSLKVQDLVQISDDPIDWTRIRRAYGLAIKNTAKDPVTDFFDPNWSGENPDEWYPLDLRFTVVVVPNGQTFSGWNNYIN